MGYNLCIGEADPRIYLEDRTAQIGVIVRASDDAPLNSTGDYRNVIYPSYLGWDDFVERYAMGDCFYARTWKAAPDRWHTGLLAHHPGAVALAEDHFDLFDGAKRSFPAGGSDLDFRRLDWLVWWTRWALDNCKFPTFANS